MQTFKTLRGGSFKQWILSLVRKRESHLQRGKASDLLLQHNRRQVRCSYGQLPGYLSPRGVEKLYWLGGRMLRHHIMYLKKTSFISKQLRQLLTPKNVSSRNTMFFFSTRVVVYSRWTGLGVIPSQVIASCS